MPLSAVDVFGEGGVRERESGGEVTKQRGEREKERKCVCVCV